MPFWAGGTPVKVAAQAAMVLDGRMLHARGAA